ncbi:MAG: OmpA family protein [Myxococcales bacterium]|nr:OmpA family protein [Myxococcales bacterium]
MNSRCRTAMTFAAALLLAVGCAQPPHRAVYTPLNVRAARPKLKPVVMKKIIQISERVEFEVNKAVLKKVSFHVLDQVVDVMKKNTTIKRVEVQGHTDSSGSPDKNMSLSQARAESVMKYLITKGIEAERLQAKGYGQTKPVASNDTPEGKQQNRRVEFHIVEQ